MGMSVKEKIQLKPVISVNGVRISPEDVNIESGNFEGGSIEDRQYRAAVSLVIRELLRQRADELELDVGDEETRLDRVVAMDVDTPEAGEDACYEYFSKNRERFRTQPLLEVRHILLAAAPDDFDGLDKQREVADELIRRLKKDPGAFKRLAKKHSACPSKEQGGNLGQLSHGQTVAEFEDKVMALPQGLAERPIESRYGWHVVDVVNRVDGDDLPFEAVRERISEYLTERSSRRAMSQYVNMLTMNADIRGIDLADTGSPLVQ